MIYESVCREARMLASKSLARPLTPEEWHDTVEDRRERWLEMLGLWPLPGRTPLEATVTGTLDRGDYVVEKPNCSPEKCRLQPVWGTPTGH